MSTAPTSANEALVTLLATARRAPGEPFRGLEPFRFADAGILAARDAEIERLVRLVTMYRGVLLYGESGAGKSSVVNAGLLPRLVEEGYWPHRVRVQPRADEELVLEPIQSSSADGDAFLPSAFEGAAQDGRLVLAASAFPAAATFAVERGRVLLVFDQFEELVTLFGESSAGSDAQPRVVDAIVRLLRSRDVRVKMLFVFREDYLASLEPLLAEQPELVDQSLRLVPPPVESARQIILAPFERFAGVFRRDLSPDLADRIAATLKQRSRGGGLNLSELQVVCRRVWEADDPAALLEARGVEGLLEDFLDEGLRAFQGADADVAITLLTRLVTSSGTRNVVSREDLLADAIEQTACDTERAAATLLRLERKAHLVRSERRRDVTTYEIVSEFLVPMIAGRKAEYLQKRKLAEAVKRTRRRARNAVAIGGAIVLVMALGTLLALNQRRHADAKAFAEAQSLHAEAQRLLATDPWKAVRLAAKVVQGDKIPAAEQTFLDANSRSHQLSVARSSRPLFQIDTSHGKVVAAGDGRTVVLSDGRSGRPVAHLTNRSPINTIAFSPDGTRVAGGSWDKITRVWDASTGRIVARFPKQADEIVQIAYHPTRDWVISLDRKGTALVWDVATEKRLATVRPPKGLRLSAFDLGPDGERLVAVATDDQDFDEANVYATATGARLTPKPLARMRAGSGSVVFGRAGQVIVFAGERLAGRAGLVRVFDARSYKARPALAHEGAVDAVAVSPDGDSLIATAQGKEIRVWDAQTGKMITVIRGHDDWINALRFRRDGHLLVSASSDGTARLWEPLTGTQLMELRGHTDAVMGADFLDTRLLATIGSDATVRVWNTFTGQELREHTNWVLDASFSPDGTRVLTAGADAAIWYWDVQTLTNRGLPGREESGTETRHSKAVNKVRFSADDKVFVSASDDGTAQIRQTEDGLLLHTLTHGGGEPIMAADVDPHPARKNRVLTVSLDWRAIVWDYAKEEQLFELNAPGVNPGYTGAHSQGVLDGRYSPDGSMIVTTGVDGVARIWHGKDGKLLRPSFNGHNGHVNAVAFPPGRSDMVATASDDGTAQVWDPRTGRVIAALPRGSSGVRAVSFSRDARWLLTGDKEGVTRVWEWRKKRLVGLMRMHADFINSAQFAPDNRILTASDDRTAKIYRCNTCAELNKAAEDVMRRVSADY